MMKRILIAALFLIAFPTHAATVSVEPVQGEAGPGDRFSLSVILTTDANAVNVVEGRVKIPFGVVVDSVSAAGSAFSLWPTYPAYFTTDHAVEFSGGAPGGIAAGKSVRLFTIHAHAERAGVYEFPITGVSAYRNDGAGTSEDISTRSASVSVRDGAPVPTIPTVATAPLVADVGQDDALFDGRYFIAFYGGDRGKGVRYEIKEGNGAFQPAERYYVIHDQTLRTPVTVRAIDADGVSVEKTLLAQPPYLLIALVVLMLIAVAVYLFMRGRKKPL